MTLTDGEMGDFKNKAWATAISLRQAFAATQLRMPAGGRIQPLPGP